MNLSPLRFIGEMLVPPLPIKAAFVPMVVPTREATIERVAMGICLGIGLVWKDMDPPARAELITAAEVALELLQRGVYA